MARITPNDFSGKSNAENENRVEINATGEETIQIPSAEFLSSSDISRDGQDLVLETAEGQSIVIQNYFSAENTPLIEAPDGSILTSDLVNSFLNSSPEYAQVESMNDVSPIGAVEEITGDAKVIRTDGSTETLSLGSPIYKGDTIETNGDGAVNISFIDETSMAVSENARLSVDEYQFDPATESGETNLSVLRGVFVFTSGLIGRDDPDDVNIDTPVGSIGIRGTVIAGKIDPGGESKVTVVEGAIVITNGVSETTLSQQYESIKLGGFNDTIENVGVQDAATIGKTYGSVSDVVPKLFSSINDNIKQESQNEQKAEESTEETIDAVEEEIQQEEVTEDVKPSTEQSEQILEIQLDGSNLSGKDNIAEDSKQQRTDKNLDRLLNENSKNRFEDLQINPELLGDKPLEVTGGFEVFESRNEGDLVARFVAKGGVGPVSFSLENGATPNVEITQNGRIVEVRLTNIGETTISGDSAGAVLSTVNILATDSAGNTKSFSFDPMVLDSVVNLNSAGGIKNFLVRDGLNLGPETIGDFNGDGSLDTVTIPDTDTVSINGTNIVNIISGSSSNTVAGVGDVNNDGYDDFVYGAPNGGGGNSGFVNLVTGNAGFNIDSPTPYGSSATGDQLGYAVAGIGDFDGDGKSDFAFSAPGDNSNLGAVHLELSTGATGLITGHSTGMKLGNNIAGLGDINGDGYSDIIFSATNQVSGNYEAYIFHGQTSALTGDATAAETTISTPYEIVGGGAAGDMNGDGFDDIAISLKMGSDVNTFVIFGHNGLPSTINMAYLENPDNALKINHAGAGSAAEYNVTDLGDINGDGFDDIQLGVVGGNEYIVHGSTAGEGMQYYNGTSNQNVVMVTDGSSNDGDSSAGKIQASAHGQSLVGNTHFIDNALNDISMKGGDGRNDFSLQSANFRKIDGGAGVEDTIRYGTNGGNLDFSAINFEQIEQIEQIHFSDNGSTIRLTAENIFNMLKTSDNGSLTIELGSSGGTPATNGTLEIDMANTPTSVVDALDEQGIGASQESDKTFNGNTYNHFEIGGYDLYIDTDVTTSVV